MNIIYKLKNLSKRTCFLGGIFIISLYIYIYLFCSLFTQVQFLVFMNVKTINIFLIYSLLLLLQTKNNISNLLNYALCVFLFFFYLILKLAIQLTISRIVEEKKRTITRRK